MGDYADKPTTKETFKPAVAFVQALGLNEKEMTDGAMGVEFYGDRVLLTWSGMKTVSIHELQRALGEADIAAHIRAQALEEQRGPEADPLDP